MVEAALADSLSPDNSLRSAALQRLIEEEKAPGFFPLLLRIYESSPVPLVRLQAVLLLKNTIERKWNAVSHSSPVKSALVPAEDKLVTKEALLRYVFSEQEQHLAAQLMVAVTHVAKFDFPEKWWELAQAVLEKVQTGLSPRPLKLLYALLKSQLSKRIPSHKAAMVKVTSVFFPVISQLWQAHTDLILEKILLIFLCYHPDRPTLLAILRRPSAFDRSAVYARKKSVAKGVRNLLACAQQVFEEEETMNTTLGFVLSAFEVGEIGPMESLLVQHSADCLSAIITAWKITEDSPSNPASVSISRFLETEAQGVTHLELLLKRLLDFLAAEDRWHYWRDHSYDLFFNEDDGEEPTIHKLIEVLFLTYPHLTFKHIPDLLANFSTFSESFQQSVITLLGLLPHFIVELKAQAPISLPQILQIVDSVPAQGFHRLVLLKGAAWLIRKWLDFVPQGFSLLPLLKQIKDTSHDLVVVYECCLTLKQMLYKGFSVGESGFILSDFASDIMQVLATVSTPQVTWHLIMLISALIEKSAYERNEALLGALGGTGIPALMCTSSEIVLCALCDMFEHLIYSSSDVPFISSLVADFISKQLPSRNENIEMLWHFAVSNSEATVQSLAALTPLLPGLSFVSSKGVYFKLLEEYLVLYKAANRPVDDLLAYITTQVLPAYIQSESYFEEAAVMSLLETIGLVNADYLVPMKTTIVGMLANARNDVYDSLLVSKTVVLLDKLILRDLGHFQGVPLLPWLKGMETLKHPNHKKVNCAALLMTLPLLPNEIVTSSADAICRLTLSYVENYAHSLDRVASEDSSLPSLARPKFTQLAPSTRKIKYQQEDSFLTINLLAVFKEQTKALKTKGVAMEEWIADQELRKQFVSLQSTSLHGRSSSS